MGYHTPVINLIVRDKVDNDSIAEDWVSINLESTNLINQNEILAIKMMDFPSLEDPAIKEKYLLLLFQGGIFASVKLQTPLHSDTYLKALLNFEDD